MTLAQMLILIRVTGLDGQAIDLNPNLIVTTRVVTEHSKDYWAKGVRCIIHTNDGKFVTVIETCEAVRRMIR